MKKLMPSVATAVLMLTVFSALLFTSCHKDHSPQSSSIYYQNNSYTTVNITVNNSSTTIPSGGSVRFISSPGSRAIGSASTAGPYGEVINWDINDIFPQSGTYVTNPLDVSSDFFYLTITSTDFSHITGLEVNYGTAAEVDETGLFIPGDGNTYDVGYYEAYSNTKVGVDFFAGPSILTSNLYIPNTDNAYYNLQVN